MRLILRSRRSVADGAPDRSWSERLLSRFVGAGILPQRASGSGYTHTYVHTLTNSSIKRIRSSTRFVHPLPRPV